MSFFQIFSTPHAKRWLVMIFTVWGVPAFLFWSGASAFQKVSFENASERNFIDLDRRLDEFAEKSSPSHFFEKRFKGFFDRISGMAGTPENFSRAWGMLRTLVPSGSVDLALFDGNGICLDLTHVADRKPPEEYFSLIRRPFTEEGTLSTDTRVPIAHLGPMPLESLQALRGEPERLCFLAGTDKSTWGIWFWNRGIPPGRVAGFLLFIHRRFMPTEFLLENALAEAQDRWGLGYRKQPLSRRSGVEDPVFPFSCWPFPKGIQNPEEPNIARRIHLRWHGQGRSRSGSTDL